MDPDVTVLTYAILDPENTNLETINAFNRTHKDVKIQPKNYTRLSENGKQGADLLNVELATGKVPDIIDLGSDGQLCQLSYYALAKKGYLEDLWPYIENDPDLGRKGVMEAFLRSAEVDGGLYTVFNAVRLSTLVGAESVVGGRTSWSVADMREAFDAMPEGEAIMDNIVQGVTVPSMKQYLLTSIVSGFIDLFIDWEAGECSFDGQRFRDILEFIHQTPDGAEEYTWSTECDPNNPDDLYNTHILRVQKGNVMLRAENLASIIRLLYDKTYFSDRPVPVGYPLGDDVVGSYFIPWNNKLCMSSSCKNKEAAWEFIRQLYTSCEREDAYRIGGIPVSKKLYNMDRRLWCSSILGGDAGNISKITKGTPEELQWFESFFGTVTRCSLFLEPAVLEMIEEEAAAYFAGAATLDQAVDRIQRRATLYVNESR